MNQQQIDEVEFTKQVQGNSAGAFKARSPSHALFTRGSRRRCRTSLALAALMGFSICLRGDATIEFSNFIEGVLDAPVYDVDGVTKLQGDGFLVSLLVDRTPFRESGPTSLAPVGFSSPFQKGTNAGYWIPQEVTLPGATAGQRIWAQVRVYESPPLHPAWPAPPPSTLWGTSKYFSIVLQDSPTPLVGLESFNLGSQDFRVERNGDNLIIRWFAFGNTTYSLQTTTDLTAAGSWNELWRESGVYPNGGSISVTTAIAGEQRFFRLRMWRQR